MEPRHARFLWLAGTRGLGPPEPLASWLGERTHDPDAVGVALVDARTSEETPAREIAGEALAVVAEEPNARALELTMRSHADDLIDLTEPAAGWRRRLVHLADLAQMRREARRRRASATAFHNRPHAVAPPAVERPPVLFVGAAGGDQLRVVDALSGWTVAAYAQSTPHACRHLENGLYAAVILSDVHTPAALEAALAPLTAIEGPSAPSFVVVRARDAVFDVDHAFALGAHDVLDADLEVDLVQRRLARAVQDAALRIELREHEPFAGARDRVTGRVGHGAFHTHVEALLRAAPHPGAALVTVTLDGLDAVNREAGFAAGDRALAAAGHGLVRVIRPVDYLGRIGGATFAIWMESMPDAALPDLAARLSARIRRDTLAEAGPPLAPRVGWARPEPGDDATALTRRARDAARHTFLRAAG